MNYKKNRQSLIDDMINNVGYIYCQHCKRSNAFKFHCHHIMFRSEKPNHKNLHNRLNLLILCDTCHSDFHNNKPLRNKYIIDRNLKELFK